MNFSNILGGLLLVGALVLSYLVFISKGEIKPFLDEEGKPLKDSIAEKTKINVNGIEQGMIIRGKNKDNPVILFLHGGPGVPEYFLQEKYPCNLEDYFTLCWWEERGSGISYKQDIEPKGISIDQLVEDTISISEYLKDKYKQDKIYLMGHSFGSFLGIRAAKERPDLYHAYIAMAQLTGNELTGTKSNTLTYEYMYKYFTKKKDRASLGKLKQYSNFHKDGSISFKEEYLAALDNLKHKAGCGTMHTMSSVISGIFLPQLNSSCYTLGEIINYWKAKARMKDTKVFQEIKDLNLFEEDLKFEIPIYFFSGVYDYTCPYPLMKELFNKIEAPKKKFIPLKSRPIPLFGKKVTRL